MKVISIDDIVINMEHDNLADDMIKGCFAILVDHWQVLDQLTLHLIGAFLYSRDIYFNRVDWRQSTELKLVLTMRGVN
jgi:hypothetical protein